MRVATWAVAAAVYALILAFAALTQPIRRRAAAGMALAAYALVALSAGTFTENFLVNVVAPGGLLLCGYWLSGFFFRDPQPWLELWLVSVDRVMAADRWTARVPRAVSALLELSYALDYVLVGGGAIYAATYGAATVAHYWSLVLASELASFAFLPWLRSRPPRALEPEVTPGTAGSLRRLNTTILNAASVQANTLPSGHVSGAVAAAFGVGAVDPIVGWGIAAAAGVIAIAAVAGRYHYVVDCVAGVAVALVFWSLM